MPLRVAGPEQIVEPAALREGVRPVVIALAAEVVPADLAGRPRTCDVQDDRRPGRLQQVGQPVAEEEAAQVEEREGVLEALLRHQPRRPVVPGAQHQRVDPVEPGPELADDPLVLADETQVGGEEVRAARGAERRGGVEERPALLRIAPDDRHLVAVRQAVERERPPDAVGAACHYVRFN